MKISLITTSINRKKELCRFIDSLNSQSNIDSLNIQLIFVDQGENKDVFRNLNSNIQFLYIKTTPCSLSHARNIALHYVTGSYIGFPDDDCWYESDTLLLVQKRFEEGYSLISGIGRNELGELTNRFSLEESKIDPYNQRGAISYTIFLRYDNKIKFDENIGVGSPYKLSSGEETDYVYQYLKSNKVKTIFDPRIIIHHPKGVASYFRNETMKAYGYARGQGYLFKKNSFPAKTIIMSFLRPLAGMFLYSLYNSKKALRSYYLLKGRIEGYFFKIPNSSNDKFS